MAFEIEDSHLMQPMRGNVYISFLAWALRKNARKKSLLLWFGTHLTAQMWERIASYWLIVLNRHPVVRRAREPSSTDCLCPLFTVWCLEFWSDVGVFLGFAQHSGNKPPVIHIVLYWRGENENRKLFALNIFALCIKQYWAACLKCIIITECISPVWHQHLSYIRINTTSVLSVNESSLKAAMWM